MQKVIRTIQSFTRFYYAMTLQWERNLLCKGYDLYEVRILLELHWLGVCTVRELASRLETRVEKMDTLLRSLHDDGLILMHADGKEKFFRQVWLTAHGKEVALKFQLLYDKAIASSLEKMQEEKRTDLLQHIKRLTELFQEAEIKSCEMKTKVNATPMINASARKY